MIDLTTYDSDAQQAMRQGFHVIADLLITDNQGRIFAQKRGPNRRLYPNVWDFVGGHLEVGESLYDCMIRECQEETGWQLDTIKSFVDSAEWESNGHRAKEYVFLASVTGDLNTPILETEKVSEYRWITEAERFVFLEGREPGDDLMFRWATTGFQKLAAH